MRFVKYFPSVFLGAVTLILTGYIVVTGWNYGRIKALEWITSICITLFFVTFVYGAVKILTVSAFKTFVKKVEPFSASDEPELKFDLPASSDLVALRNHCDRLHFMFRKALYEPMSLEEQERLQKKYRREDELETILNELLLFTAFLFTLTVLLINLHSSLSFYSTKNIVDVFVDARLSLISLSDIVDDRNLMFYLENVLVSNMHEGKDEKGEIIPSGNGWVMEKFVRMLGVSRLRQTRAKKFQCGDELCVFEYSESSKESRDFNVGWKFNNAHRYKKKYWRIEDPWKFGSDWKLKTLHHSGAIASYPGSGYVSNLGRTGNNSFTILNFLSDNNWIDRQTKSLFIEATFYSVDSGIFNVVTLVLERTPFGNWVASSDVQTANLLTGFTAFRILLPFAGFLAGLSILVYTTGTKMKSLSFLKNIWNIVDVVIIILSIAFVTSTFLRNSYVGHLVNQLKTSRNNEFVSFHLVAFHDYATSITAGFLISIATVRLWKTLSFSSRFRALKLTLFDAAHSLTSIAFLFIIFLIGFSSTIYIINGSQSEPFSTFTKTFTVLMAHSLGFNRNIRFDNLMHGGRLLGIFVFAIMMVFVNILMLNMFTTIVCIHIKKIKEEMKKEPTTNITMWKVVKKKFLKIIGKLPKDELKFLHRDFTINRANHIKITIDAHIELLCEYSAKSQKSDE